MGKGIINGVGKNWAKFQLTLAMIIFGTIGLFVKNIDLPSSLIAMVRGTVGALFLVVLTAVRHGHISRLDIQRNLVKLILSGGFLGINWILLFEAYRHTTVAGATLAYYTAPVLVIIVSALFFKESLEPLKAIYVVLALIGMVLVSGILDGETHGVSDLTGILFGLGAAVFYAGVILVSKQLDSISSYDGTIVQLAVSAIVLTPYVFWTEDLTSISITTRSLLPLTIVAVVHTGVAYALYFRSMKTLKAQTIAMFSYLDPFVAVVVSAIILKEEVTTMTLLGGLLILGSTLMSSKMDGKME